MRKRGFKYAAYAVTALVLVLAFAYATPSKGVKFKFLETSLLSIFKEIAAENRPPQPDLAIESISLKKISAPDADFDYYRYEANVVIKNLGGKIKNAAVVLGSDNGQRHVFVKNSPEGLTLAKGQSVIIEDYDVILDGDYNGGTVALNVAMKDLQDADEKNNTKNAELFEGPAKIEGIGTSEILEDGTVILDLDFPKAAAGKDIEILVSNELETAEEKYAETVADEKVYGFYRIKNDAAAIENGKWQVKKIAETGTQSLKIGGNIFGDGETRYVFVRAIDPQSGNYLASNILKFSPHEQINRAEFAKLMVDYAEMEIFDDGESIYEDVSLDSWYGSYVQTLYNLGLIRAGDYKYRPDKAITRGEVLRVALDYFDVDLAVSGEGGHFEDIGGGDGLYAYAEALYESGKAGIFADLFSPDAPATKDFLKYLVHAYSQNS